MTRYSVSPSRPTSYSAQTWGWESCDTVLASRSNLWRASGVGETCDGSTLTATSRESRESFAR